MTVKNITFTLIDENDEASIQTIAGWYQQEWDISPLSTKQRLAGISVSGLPFHVLMEVDGLPIATGGVHFSVSLLTSHPRLSVHKYWLALVYTLPAFRNQGYGSMLCSKIESIANARGIECLHLFTHTAESLYKKLGWKQIDSIDKLEKQVVIMHKFLTF